MTILGISALYHDSAAAIVSDGKILAAAQEERFTRKKSDASVPVHAIRYCISCVQEKSDQVIKIDQVVYYDHPFLTMDRWLTDIVEMSPDNGIMVDKSFLHMVSDRVWIHERLKQALGTYWPKGTELYVCEHHISHAASAFYPSPYEEAAILTIDGVGEWATTSIGYGKGEKIHIIKQINYPDSLGLLYSAFTYFCGFQVNEGEYKLMGLASYGKPKYKQLILDHMIQIKDDGTYTLNQQYFTYRKDVSIIGEAFGKLFGIKKREPESKITRPYLDLAASIQQITEEAVLLLAKSARQLTGQKNLVMAGGSALNCVANGKIIEEELFENVWVQPAAGDAGGALGCALYATYYLSGCKREIHKTDAQNGSYLGPFFSNKYTQTFLKGKNIVFHEYADTDLFSVIAKYLEDDKVIGLYHGRMEYGPRALGNRSIIANPMSVHMQSDLNRKIKFRESFRPFAPAVLAEDAERYFDFKGSSSPYMTFTAQVKEELCIKNEGSDIEEDIYKLIGQKRSVIPAVTHVDYSARIQTVHKETNPFFYHLIQAFRSKTGCGIVLNTSFNVRGEPIVCTPEDALRCFWHTGMDVLVLGNYLIIKEEQTDVNQIHADQVYVNQVHVNQNDINASDKTAGWSEVIGTLYDDKNRIRKIADQLADEAGKLPRPEGPVFSISPYAFDTPVELQQQLSQLWDRLKKPQMKRFLSVITAAVYKNKEEEIPVEPSVFNYEF